ncbi:MAG: CDP-archaeol synthase [Prolixibacteraceae bacterium]|nr:CDP-archaeol synthase [Prolixibacteraceae bacterium]MDD4754890.1 CDP-archaeol synthase [Prolixibacteraceae bacterium]NLO03898.1 CDP-archaeol synthase [Bacteroidales bacterium]
MNNFTKRLLSGCVYALLMLAGAAFHPVLFVVIYGVLLFFTQFEFYNLVEKAGSSPRKITGLSVGMLLFLVCFGMVNNLLPAKSFLLFIPALTFIFLYEVFSDKNAILQNSAVTFTGFIYVAIPFSLLNFIVYPGYPAIAEYSPSILIGVLFIIWVYDTTAYLSGTAFGKHKINKKISPNKSWEGVIGGTTAALIMGTLNSVIFAEYEIMNWLIISILTVIFGTLGDLFESVIKRRINVKDSGTILPGHGGLLDRLDSLLFVIPVVYVWLIFSGNL